jgi:hypothetical protein
MKRSLLLALVLSAAVATAALAQAPISTRAAQDAPPADTATAPTLDKPTQSQVEAAQWARDVLARANGQLPPTNEKAVERKTADETKPSCQRNPDRAVHGSAGVAVGSDGYRHADIYAEKPIGDCGSIAVGISKSEGGRRGRFR